MKLRTKTGCLAAVALAGALLAGCAYDDRRAGYADSGYVAFGYQDGYWDRDHQWRRWDNDDQAHAFRARHREHYYERTHDADHDDHDMGWRNERWWDRR